MQTLFVGFIDDAVDPGMKSMAIRLAYVLSEEIRIAGDIPLYYDFENSMRTISFLKKIKFIEESTLNQANPIQLSQRYKDFEKLYKKTKGNSKELLVTKKKLEKSIDDMFNTILVDTVNAVKNLGLTDLKPIEDSSFYGEYYISYNNAEKEIEGSNKLSDILTLNLDEEDNNSPAVFILNDLFFSPGFDAENNEKPAMNSFSEKGFFQLLCTFPDYNVFSVADLNTLRFELKESLEKFQLAVDAFAALHENPAKAFNYLQNDVVNVANKLAGDINKTALVTSYKNLKSFAIDAGKLYFGMIPHYMVIKYFQFIKAAQKETIAIVDKFPEDKSNQFVPVIIITFNKEVIEETTAITQSQSLPLKKTLSID